MKDYRREQATATRLITKFGGEAELRREAGAVTNPFDPLPAVQTFQVTIVETGENSLTRRADSAALAWTKAGLMAAQNGVKPEPTDKLRISGRDYTVLQVMPLTPNPDGETVLYEWVVSE